MMKIGGDVLAMKSGSEEFQSLGSQCFHHVHHYFHRCLWRRDGEVEAMIFYSFLMEQPATTLRQSSNAATRESEAERAFSGSVRQEYSFLQPLGGFIIFLVR
ncbi:hypothetical protein K469DRAFT_100007 [Zopfia rhizophila CBS 207.26]|uniref:Uncharacterized protein n=1 Tax=Zopfia rhizophila CBS 207.26 TaxID=1314779 RepID=A0A6A6EDT3_9PEZI|nr:hypothetical protein K469DRAFT_100007 [Zopfia rhizophila CBS 207.26]